MVFKKLKEKLIGKKEEKEEKVEEIKEEEVQPEVVEEPEKPKITIQEKIAELMNLPENLNPIPAPATFKIQFLAGGDAFYIIKEELKHPHIEPSRTRAEDVFIRISNAVVDELLEAPDFDTFNEIFRKYAKSQTADHYVKVDIRTDIFELNKKGFASSPFLKMLVLGR